MNGQNLKTAIVCMVHNGQEYLSEFVFHHLNLVDHIFFIDHNSERDLRNLSIQNVTCVRSNQEAQFQSECTNIVIEHFNIKKEFDWLFVLDIDEFLPFKNKDSFHAFLNKHDHVATLQFFWRNGVPFFSDQEELPPGLIDCCSIRFFSKNSVNYKTFVHAKKVKGHFVVPTGAHRIDYVCRQLISWNPFRRRYKRYIPVISEFPLFHIVAFNKDAFVKKIKIYVEQMKYREHIKGQGGWVVRDYPENYNGDEWLWYIGNFRVTNPTDFFEVRPEYFLEEPIFDHLNYEEVTALRQKILSFPRVQKIPANESEKKYLEYKNDDGDIVGNIKWFYIDDKANVVVSVPPKFRRNN